MAATPPPRHGRGDDQEEEQGLGDDAERGLHAVVDLPGHPDVNEADEEVEQHHQHLGPGEAPDEACGVLGQRGWLHGCPVSAGFRASLVKYVRIRACQGGGNGISLRRPIVLPYVTSITAHPAPVAGGIMSAKKANAVRAVTAASAPVLRVHLWLESGGGHALWPRSHPVAGAGGAPGLAQPGGKGARHELPRGLGPHQAHRGGHGRAAAGQGQRPQGLRTGPRWRPPCSGTSPCGTTRWRPLPWSGPRRVCPGTSSPLPWPRPTAGWPRSPEASAPGKLKETRRLPSGARPRVRGSGRWRGSPYVSVRL